MSRTRAPARGAPDALREGRGIAETQAPPIVHEVVRSPGEPLERGMREVMESRFGHDFSRVRVHTDTKAAQSTDAVSARAYTLGDHIAFGPGPRDQQLLAHELTHVVQQSGGGRSLQRKPKEKDPLCDSFDLAATKKLVATQAAAFKANPKTPQRHALIRTLKWIVRCAGPEEQAQIRSDAAIEPQLWKEAATPFGGYTGMYSGYSPGTQGNLQRLGASETVSSGSYETAYYDLHLSDADRPKEHGRRAKTVAGAATGALERTDIIYFMGHHYGRHAAPGVFALATADDERDETRGVDLRYFEKKGGFANVKVMISTGCATLCKQAFDVFHGLFPNAVLFGYRGAAPEQGHIVRNAFDAHLKKLGPLLLDQAVDVNALISAWKATVAAIHAGDSGTMAGYYDGAALHYWNGKAWRTIAASSDENECPREDDFSKRFPSPAESRR